MFLSASCVPCNDRTETSSVRFIGIIHLIFVVEGDEGDIAILFNRTCFNEYIYTTILPPSCSDGRYFYHISGTALF